MYYVHSFFTGDVFIVPTLCSIFGVCGVFAIIVLVVWHNRHIQMILILKERDNPLLSPEDRHLINENLVTHYPNPIYKNAKFNKTMRSVNIAVNNSDQPLFVVHR